MRKLNPSHISAIIDMGNHQNPFVGHLSIKIKDIGVGFSVLEVDVENKHRNLYGYIHGGVYASLIDTATFWAAYGEIDEDAGMVTLELKVNYLSAIEAGKILVNGKSIKVGRTIALAEATITDLEGKTLAHGTSTLLLTPGRQTINQALNKIGLKSIPPKFIE